MKSIDKTVIKETEFIALFTLILSLLMQSIFLIIGKWDYTVLLGNLLTYIASIGNFLLMGITVQKAVTKDEAEAKKLMKLSQSGRLWIMFIFLLVGILVPVFNNFAVIIPVIFPRISIFFRKYFVKED